MEKVKKYWKLLLTLQPVYEIYGHMLLSDKDIFMTQDVREDRKMERWINVLAGKGH